MTKKTKVKGKKSSEVAKECSSTEIMAFAGILKTEKKKLDTLKKKIAAEREGKYGRRTSN